MDYHIHNGLRKIKPYWNTRSSFVKGRWFNKTVAQVLVDEFHLSEDEVRERIKKNHYQLLRENLQLDCNKDLIKNKDVFISKQHNHEPPVLQWGQECRSNSNIIAGIPVIYEDNNMLVLNKPCGIPVHPTAYYYKNTITELLKDELPYPVFSCHRLDKITSGILIFGKNQGAAGRLHDQIRSHTMQKWYLARVEGDFPDKPVLSDSPIYTFEPKKSLKGAFSTIREAATEFQKLAYNQKLNESLVLCKPVTGRTHQLRIHLMRLGYPIVNDPFYNLRNTRYPKRTEFMKDVEDWSVIPYPKLETLFKEFIAEIESVWRMINSRTEVCNECGEELPDDPDKKDLTLYLHAWKYVGNELTLGTDYPKWCSIFDFEQYKTVE